MAYSDATEYSTEGHYPWAWRCKGLVEVLFPKRLLRSCNIPKFYCRRLFKDTNFLPQCLLIILKNIEGQNEININSFCFGEIIRF